MINVTDIFIKGIKKLFKDKGLSPFEYVFCFVCGGVNVETEVELSFMILPLEAFEKNHEKLPFSSFMFYKKDGCFFACDVGAFFHLINKRLTRTKTGDINFLKAPERGKNSICGFVGKCLLEYMKNEKLSRKELSIRLKIPYNKFNLILKGDTGAVGIDDMISISFEFQGRNNKSTYKVIIEKYPEKQKVNKIDSDLEYI